ncbi:unnamed protein product [Arabidopsis lyrata]|uniref:Protein kinase domain-containing protein n=1 Tax=Arabidopsis lyrata subsp. lyrata TaxID=81972 RepID=D7LF55_ARALL|nr:mitogen-activated protein kinase kinase kinase 3 [Arabidopsis lyrata subsp. lyrata]EFH57985.1 hypothetical protein ARALYDRAFT_903349 [Arabidopsis lyrata subsp. lyrata]CAH8265452.1 unnamed protein product [Arabidopsis lyrata]|eukprot:XP_002881726.1 mitogen-activated protein kinase kinase kinase 3 [Arabidopsis lyrata subsp. lyrata]
MEQLWRDDDWIVDESSLSKVSSLGGGSFGRVSLEKDSNSGRLYAKKSSRMHLQKILEKELRIMHRFRNHPRIVQASNKLHFQTKPYEYCNIFMEYASKGNLYKILSGFPDKSQPIPESLVSRAARMILEGLVALHSHGYVHCDLKPSNVLVFPSTTPGEPWDLKLADFGSSKEPDSEYDFMSLGTAQYIPSESFGPNGLINPGHIDPRLDIYALGCVVYEMFGALPKQEYFEYYYDWILHREISPEAQDFLRRCHDMHPHRPSATQLLNHSFITQRLPWPTTEDDKEISARLLIPSVSKLLLT